MLLLIAAVAFFALGLALDEFSDPIAKVLQLVGLLLLLYVLPATVHQRIVTSRPSFGAFVRGEGSYVGPSHLVARIVVVALYAGFLVILALATALLLYFTVDWLKEA